MNHSTGTRSQWNDARQALLQREKELTRMSDTVAQQRLELPWVRVDDQYVFDTEHGPKTLADLFDEEKAALQTRKLCMYCGHGMGVDAGQIAKCQVCDGVLMRASAVDSRTSRRSNASRILLAVTSTPSFSRINTG